MSTRGIARGIVGSVRLVGITAALAAGIAGFASAGAAPAETDVVVAAKKTSLPQVAQLPQLRQLPEQACANVLEHAPARVAVKHGCLVIGDSGPIDGPPLFS